MLPQPPPLPAANRDIERGAPSVAAAAALVLAEGTRGAPLSGRERWWCLLCCSCCCCCGGRARSGASGAAAFPLPLPLLPPAAAAAPPKIAAPRARGLAPIVIRSPKKGEGASMAFEAAG